MTRYTIASLDVADIPIYVWLEALPYIEGDFLIPKELYLLDKSLFIQACLLA